MNAVTYSLTGAKGGGSASRWRGALVSTSGDRSGVLNGADLGRLLDAIAMERDRQAFALLYKHFAPRLKTFLMKAGAAPNAAEELVQETMLAVWRKASYFDQSRAGAATWIFAIARNLHIDQLRRNRWTSSDEIDMSEEPDDSPDGEAVVLATERDAQVRQALQTLSKEQATIVQLSFFSEKAHADIARELGIPLGTVKSRVRLALNRLRTLLDAST